MAGQGGHFAQGIPALRRHEHGLRFDAQLSQHAEQQDRLGLAVAVFLVPCQFGVLRQVIAAIETVHQIADVFLHQPRGRDRTGKRVGAGSPDCSNLAGKFAAGLYGRGGFEVRRHLARQFLPIGETGNFQDRRALEAARRVVRHGLAPRDGKFERKTRAPPDRLRFYALHVRACRPQDVVVCRPARDNPAAADLLRFAGQEMARLDFVAQRLVVERSRIGHAKPVADLEARNCDRCRQDAVEEAHLQPAFAPQRVEAHALLDQVDDLPAAQDLEGMNSQVALVG